MADVLSSQKNTNHGLEKLTVPNWDGSRKNYATWKSEFNYWVEKYKQDKDEQLQKLRKALPKDSFREIKSGLAKRSIRHGKFWTLYLEIKEN